MNIIEVLSDLFIFHGTPEYIRSDNGSEFTQISSENGLNGWKSLPLILSQKALGKTDIAKVLMEKCAMSSLMAKFLIH